MTVKTNQCPFGNWSMCDRNYCIRERSCAERDATVPAPMLTVPVQAAGARFVGMRAQACDCGECKPITIMAEPQRAADGSWQVLVMFDERTGYITPLGIEYLWLKEPKQ